ncbi:MAG: CvpA family protein [Holosporaceae bacterium]|jgi:membrane protein required for colicin V production|nr:CvpA family protein [Holosporaceae bacterium]
MANPSFFNLLDYVYIIILLISCLSGFTNGFTKVLLNTITWCGSCIVSSMVSPLVRQFIAQYFENKIIINVISVILAYVGVLIIALLLVRYISDRVKQSFLSAVDRALGLFVGFLRGILIPICVCAIFWAFNIPKKRFSVVKNSRISSIILDNMKNVMKPPEKKKITQQIRHKSSDMQKSITKLLKT